MKLTRLFLITLSALGGAALFAQAPDAAAEAAALAEQAASGYLAVGTRFITPVQGDFNTYRTVVNLGEGVRLLDLDMRLNNESGKLLDTLLVRGGAWGGDPYNTAFVEARKNGVYTLRVDYRNIAHFNFLPSFANPQLDLGILLNQQSLDIMQRTSDIELELRPGKGLRPYVGFLRTSGNGRGILNFVANQNEYPATNLIRDHTNNYRAGLRGDFRLINFELEAGGTTFRDDQQVIQGTRIPGNRRFPFLSQQLFLSEGLQAYGVRGDSKYSRAYAASGPARWVRMTGTFLFSQPETEIKFQQANVGNFVLPAPLTFYAGQLDDLTGAAKMPHTTANGTFELMPWRRLRILESVTTDRMRNATSALLAQRFLLAPIGAAPSINQTLNATDRMEINFQRQELNVLLDATRWLTLRGGHRYVWGDTQVRSGVSFDLPPLERGEMKRQSALAGVVVRPASRVSVNFNAEVARSDKIYFRTSLQDYNKYSLLARVQMISSLTFHLAATMLDNQNAERFGGFEFENRQITGTLMWTPQGGRYFNVVGEYTRAAIRSNISFLNPTYFQLEPSRYRDYAHVGNAILTVPLRFSASFQPRVGVGGSLMKGTGSRPTDFYQPRSSLTIPIGKRIEWDSEWRWFGLSQSFYRFEGFRNHQFVTGLRLLM